MTPALLKRAIFKAAKANAIEDTPETRAALKKACSTAKSDLTSEEIEAAIDRGYQL